MKLNVTARLLRQFIIIFQPCSNSHDFMEDNVHKSMKVFMHVHCINFHKSMQTQCINVCKVLQIYRIAIICIQLNELRQCGVNAFAKVLKRQQENWLPRHHYM